MKISVTVASMFAMAAAAVATANSHPDVVKSRQSDMKAMAEMSKALNDYFLGKRPYNPTKFKAAANAIRKDAAGLTAHFSDVIEAPGSSASPFIKVDRVKFEELSRHLEQYAAQVSAAAQSGKEIPAAMRMNPREMTEGGPFAKKSKLAADVSSYSSEHAFHMMLQTCTACHAKFRMKSN
jgi:cytochrome c556